MRNRREIDRVSTAIKGSAAGRLGEDGIPVAVGRLGENGIPAAAGCLDGDDVAASAGLCLHAWPLRVG